MLPGSHEEHGFASEVLHILIAKWLAVVVLEYLEAIGGLELSVIQRLEAHRAAEPQESHHQHQFKYIPSHLNYIFYTWQPR